MEMWATPLILSNGTAIFNITFQVIHIITIWSFLIFFYKPQLLKVCPEYQSSTYSIIIYDDTAQQVIQFEPIVYRQENNTDPTILTMEVKFDAVNYIPFYEVEIVIGQVGFFTSNRTKILNLVSKDWQTTPPIGVLQKFRLH